MSLKDQLDEQMSAMAPVAREAVADLVQRLRAAGTIDGALKPGNRMPAFELPNAEGRLVTTDDLLAHGPIVITFFRGDWCPFCSLCLHALEEALPSIEAAGGRLVALSPDTGGRALELKRRSGLHYEVLTDVDNGVALAFGIAFRVLDTYRDVLLNSGIDLAERHGNGGWFVPIPASFVVDRSGVIRHVFADVDFTHRPDPEDIVRVLRGL